ncbi:hypothetical protein POJ06DRAFT_260850 [Lipomyces tetrasporus]|uniref:Uncharacterized protein n=1 Tax=Lipomyces tetrasporus TaxID=54092 RepID=A0AAD7QMS5_9ASCO|nr:uncharacterized protein POJ06DRAFT_260850 [Lipomyces tetrasporus]KAJ8098068.1 hypothetical protein POJ06DRAFT_260850 [Lipomyces tetrasporus]
MTPLSWLGEKVGQEELEDSQRLPRLCNEQQIGQKGCDDVDPAEGLGTLGVPVLHLIINPRGIWATGRVYLVLVFPALMRVSQWHRAMRPEQVKKTNVRKTMKKTLPPWRRCG